MKSFKRMLSFFLVLSFSLLFLGTTGLVKNVKADTEATVTLASGVYSGEGTTGQILWTENYMSILQTKGKSSTNVSESYVSAPRWYGSHVITFKPSNGATITGVTIVCTTNAYASTLKTSTWSTGVTAAVSSSTVTVNCNTDDDFTVTLGGQTRISSIKYTYTGISSTAVTGVALDQSAITVANGTVTKLTPTIAPGNATNQKVIWTSSDKTVACVVDGNVYALNSGTAIITCTTDDGAKTATCNVTVNSTNPMESFECTAGVVDDNSITMSSTNFTYTHSKGEGTTFGAYAPWRVYASNKLTITGGSKVLKLLAVIMKTDSSNSNIGPITGNCGTVINAVSSGDYAVVGGLESSNTKTVTITASVQIRITNIYCIYVVDDSVSDVPVTNVNLDATSKSVYVRDTFALTATVSPEGATDKTLTWTSSDDTVATVENGIVKTLKAGTATITATSNSTNTVKGTCEVTVNEWSQATVATNFLAINTTTVTFATNYSDNYGVHMDSTDTYSYFVNQCVLSSGIQMQANTGKFENLAGYSKAIKYILVKTNAKAVPIVSTGTAYGETTTVSSAKTLCGYNVYAANGENDTYFALTANTTTSGFGEVIVCFNSNYAACLFEMNTTLSNLALTYTDNGDETFTVDDVKLRFGVHNVVTKELYDALIASGSTVTFGVELTVNGTTKDHTNTVVFVDVAGKAVAASSATYVNFSVVVPVTQATNYAVEVTGKAYVSVDGVKFYMAEKSNSVDTLCDYYTSKEVVDKYSISKEIQDVLTYIYVML